jgi:cobalt-precorrin-5B (C1)-methyltransferase
MDEMAQETSENAARRPGGALRRGWTTGACAAAAAKAAGEALLGGAFPDPVTVRLTGDRKARFALADRATGDGWARAGIVKDAGDDPDVTHGALVSATVTRGTPGSGVTFAAGEGVGTVTLPGLALAVGEPAINPKPRAMITAALAEIAGEYGATDDFLVTVAIAGGAALALRTANPRLGIVGGLSVLGTTGIVVPYSCASWVHSIHRGIDVARANDLAHIAAATGRTSEAAVQALYGLPETALIDMGDFAGGMLKYLRDHPVRRITIAGGFGKLSKLATGALDLHSQRSQVDTGDLSDRLAALGLAGDAVAAARRAPGAGAVLAIAASHGLDRALADDTARRARAVARAVLAGSADVELAIFDRNGGLIGHAGP